MTTDLGKIGMTPRGVFNSLIIYERLDIVTFEGSSYISLVNGNNFPLSNNTAWQLLVKKGEDYEILYNNDFDI